MLSPGLARGASTVLVLVCCVVSLARNGEAPPETRMVTELVSVMHLPPRAPAPASVPMPMPMPVPVAAPPSAMERTRTDQAAAAEPSLPVRVAARASPPPRPRPVSARQVVRVADCRSAACAPRPAHARALRHVASDRPAWPVLTRVRAFGSMLRTRLAGDAPVRACDAGFGAGSDTRGPCVQLAAGR